ncbi:class I SAM-dependent methyltransferase [Actinomadura graeca]|uniref:Class I SAM-dependent methyltransferase n=1 Tax=Actinomadura graeca TaxID=2750812 RepID=A0ABX8QU60_9ACTN|nr:class I SAM-dependent methyltransferase [Actinomadura graeca]QXJ22360.1 class I SAM-dependent methyltransferase [Actinomadura graeca]
MDAMQAALGRYLLSHCESPDDVLRDLAVETEATAPDLHITHYEGALLSMITRITGARRVVGVGVFTGYSSLCIARAMPEDGRLLALEINAEWAAIAERYWKRAGVDHKIDLRVGPAADALLALPEDDEVDFAFIDADKVNHRLYYEELLRRMRPGGLILLADSLRGGRVLKDDCDAEDVVAVRELNEAVHADDRVDSLIFPSGDGATMVRKR